MNKYEIINISGSYLISGEDEFTCYDFYDVPKQIIDIIKQLEQENNQLKEQRQELRRWLEEHYDYSECIKIKSVLNKLNELEDGKNE